MALAESDFVSGPWTGYFLHQGQRVPQDLELTFDAGVLRGGGWDQHGQFLVRGSYRLDSGEVNWTKKYDDGLRLACRGFRDGKGIWGTFRGSERQRGGFHVWPLAAP